jgi:hypothetical protein
MRSAAFCLLAIAAPACNWVFGIETTIQTDAAIPTDAQSPIARLTYLVAVTDASGVPAPIHEVRPIMPPPSVKIGRIGDALTDASIDDTGSIVIPAEYQASTWRLVYQLEDDIPREMHWTTTAGQIPHAIVPLYGRTDRDPIPGPNTRMVLTPTSNGPATHSAPTVYTTGVWTQSVPPASSTGSTYTHDFNQSIQLSGPAGAPNAAKGDQVVLVDYITEGSCRVSSGSAAFKLDLTNGPSSTISAEMLKTSRSLQVTSVYLEESDDRARAGFAAGGATATRIVQFGIAASTTMPAFTQRLPRQPTLDLRGPLLFPMLDCTGATAVPLPLYNQPDALTVFPQLGHVQMVASRMVSGGPSLPHGVAGVAPISGGTAAFDTSVAMPVPPFLLGTFGTALADDADLPAGTGPLVLSWDIEANAAADYFEVVLHRIEAGSAVPERAYTTTAKTLTLDRADLTKDLEYVFQIRAFRGAPFVQLADFTRYLPTQSTAVVWTHTFFPR